MSRYRIGVATARARPYYAFVRWLARLGAPYDVMAPSMMHEYAGDAILTTRGEAPRAPPKPVLYDDDLERGHGIALATLLKRCGAGGFDDRLVVGVDPGGRLGLSVLYAGREVERDLFHSVEDLASHLSDVLRWRGPSGRTVRIGDGDMETAVRLAAALSARGLPPYRLEFVDEANTSPRGRRRNRRGERDMLAAGAIALTDPGTRSAAAG